jgi:hypothetical protein
MYLATVTVRRCLAVCVDIICARPSAERLRLLRSESLAVIAAV